MEVKQNIYFQYMNHKNERNFYKIYYHNVYYSHKILVNLLVVFQIHIRYVH
jgi:hypothetical protein